MIGKKDFTEISYLCIRMIHYIQLLRPLQWLKNFFVFAPIFFSNKLLEADFFWPTLVVFASFCLISSSIYCFNDLRDVEADRQHPKKCKRPIASGAVSVKGGYAMMLICTISAFLLIPLAKSANTPYLYIIAAAYWLMNIAYCIKLKQFAILDVAIIAVGFVKPRVSITGYNKTFINEATAIIASVTMVCYIMYTMSPEVIERMGTRYVYLTSGWVLAGLLRYLQNMIVFGLSGSPTKSIVKDHFVQLCIIGWIASFFAIIYL